MKPGLLSPNLSVWMYKNSELNIIKLVNIKKINMISHQKNTNYDKVTESETESRVWRPINITACCSDFNTARHTAGRGPMIDILNGRHALNAGIDGARNQ